jgi:hypothetical protein
MDSTMNLQNAGKAMKLVGASLLLPFQRSDVLIDGFSLEVRAPFLGRVVAAPILGTLFTFVAVKELVAGKPNAKPAPSLPSPTEPVRSDARDIQ